MSIMTLHLRMSCNSDMALYSPMIKYLSARVMSERDQPDESILLGLRPGFYLLLFTKNPILKG